MKKLILTLAVAAFALSPMISEAGGRGAEQLISHHKAGPGGVAKPHKITRAPKHAGKKHKKHQAKHHKKHHKKHKKH